MEKTQLELNLIRTRCGGVNTERQEGLERRALGLPQIGRGEEDVVRAYSMCTQMSENGNGHAQQRQENCSVRYFGSSLA